MKAQIIGIDLLTGIVMLVSQQLQNCLQSLLNDRFIPTKIINTLRIAGRYSKCNFKL